MKMRRSVLIILALMVAILVACTRRDPTPTPVPPTKAPTAVPLPTNTVAPPATEAPPGDQAWARIQANGRMIVGTAADYPPFEYYTSSFLLDGFDIALMRAIGEKMGVQVEFRDIAFDGLGGALQVDQIDAAISAISANTDRAELVDFSNIYLITEDAVIAANDAPYTITDITDLAEFRVGVQRLSVYEDWLRDNLVDEELMEPTNLFVYQNANEIQTALTEGEIDLAVVDRPVAEVAAQAGDYKIIGQGLYPQRLAIAMKQDSPTLQAEINRVLSELQLDGTVAQLALQHLTIERLPPITDPTPPTGDGGDNVACIDAMQFVNDVNLDDDNMRNPPQISPGVVFEKIWRLRNVGTCTWTAAYTAQFVGGNNGLARMGGLPTNLVGEVRPGQEYDLTVRLVSPLFPGVYQGFWQLFNASNVGFGERFWVGITVPGSPTPTPLPTATPSPDINFTADRTTINQGECATLSWRVQNVRAVFLYPQGEPWDRYPVVGEGTRTVCPTTTTTYELRVVRLDNSVEIRQIRIQVNQTIGAPTIRRFTVDPPYQIFTGQCVTVQWIVEGAVDRVRITRNNDVLQDGSPFSGSRQDCPPGTGEQAYNLEAIGPGGTSRQQVFIQVIQPTAEPPTPTPVPPNPPPVILSFSVSPGQVQVGQCVSIYWRVSGGVSWVQIMRDGNVVLDGAPLNGQTSDCPAAPGTITYRVEARNNSGDVAAQNAAITVTQSTPQNPLANSNWSLATLYVNQLPVPDTTVTAYFSADGAISGNASCNTYNGRYTVDGSSLVFTPLITTGLTCGDAANQQEAAFLAAMASVQSFEIAGNQLILRDEDGAEVARFTRIDR